MKEFIVEHIHELCFMALSTATNILTFISYRKAKKRAKLTIEAEEIQIEEIEDLKKNINQLIKDAEKFKHYTKEEKKQYVMTRAIALGQGIMNANSIDEYVEEQVDLTNNVNVSKVKAVK